MSFAKTTSILSLVIGVTGLSAVTTHFSTAVTIEDEIKEHALPTTDAFDSEWESINTKLTQDNSDPKTPELKEIKNSKSTNNGKSIREWCKKIYTKTYDSLVMKKNTGLIIDAKNFCIYTIKEKLTTTKILDTSGESGKAEIQTKLQSLKNSNDLSSLDETLKALKEKISKDSAPGDNDDWKILRDWCGSAYKKGYKGENTEIWKTVNSYCTK